MNWIINIENSAAQIADELGWDVVRSVLNKYGAASIEDLNPADYCDVFSELYAIEADLK